jgi:hypothetical protein
VLQDLGANGTFGIYVNASPIVTLAQRTFAALPHTLDVNGAPNSYGPIHLTDIAVSFPSTDDVSKGVNNFIKTYVNGYDTQVWPPVHFTTTLSDTLGLNDDTDPACPERQCQSAPPQISYSGVDILSDVLVTFFTVAFPYLLLRAILALLNLPNAAGQAGGVGCGVYDALPEEIPLPFSRPVFEAGLARFGVGGGVQPHPQKIHLCYTKARADSRGLLVSAIEEVRDRTPSAEILGPDSLVIDLTGTTTFGSYSVEAFDFFGDLSFTWSGGSPERLHAQNTDIIFSRGNAKPGETLQQSISVRVTDSEGSTVTASITVSIYVSTVHIPPYCKYKPWLKQCQALGL